MRIRFFVQGGNKKMERAQAILPEATQQTRTRSPVLYEEDSVQTVIVAELVVDQPASQPPPTPSPPVPATEAAEQQTQETGLTEAEVNEVISDLHSDTLRRGVIAFGIAGLVWGSLAGIIGIQPMAIAIAIIAVLTISTLVYRGEAQDEKNETDTPAP